MGETSLNLGNESSALCWPAFGAFICDRSRH